MNERKHDVKRYKVDCLGQGCSFDPLAEDSPPVSHKLTQMICSTRLIVRVGVDADNNHRVTLPVWDGT
jgi:hypothetical protein